MLYTYIYKLGTSTFTLSLNYILALYILPIASLPGVELTLPSILSCLFLPTWILGLRQNL